MRRIMALALLLIAATASAAGVSSDNSIIRSFCVDVTTTAQGFTIQSKTGKPSSSNCNAWSVTNNDAVGGDAVWFVVGESGQTAYPVAVALNCTVNQFRVGPGETWFIDAFATTYISIVGAGNANIRFQATCHL